MAPEKHQEKWRIRRAFCSELSTNAVTEGPLSEVRCSLSFYVETGSRGEGLQLQIRSESNLSHWIS